MKTSQLLLLLLGTVASNVLTRRTAPAPTTQDGVNTAATVGHITSDFLQDVSPELLAHPEWTDAQRRTFIEAHVGELVKARYPNVPQYLVDIAIVTIDGAVRQQLTKKKATA